MLLLLSVCNNVSPGWQNHPPKYRLSDGYSDFAAITFWFCCIHLLKQIEGEKQIRFSSLRPAHGASTSPSPGGSSRLAFRFLCREDRIGVEATRSSMQSPNSFRSHSSHTRAISPSNRMAEALIGRDELPHDLIALPTSCAASRRAAGPCPGALAAARGPAPALRGRPLPQLPRAPLPGVSLPPHRGPLHLRRPRE